ncbi:MAG: IS66 family insertion sequence element accessory protein TnpA [Acidiferrobacter sp.]
MISFILEEIATMPAVLSREEWRQLLAEQAAGQQTIRAFCHDKGIGLSTFSAWKRRLAGTQGPSVVKRRAFVPVAVSQISVFAENAVAVAFFVAAMAVVSAKRSNGCGMSRRPHHPPKSSSIAKS